ncbi:MAG: Planctomycete cytochrome, partial [Armatimonadetes bacterium]|nr:Planctomycete cytochrome [Armatimonadota bacterium]
LGGTYHGAERESLSPAGKAAAEREREALSGQIASLQERLKGLSPGPAAEQVRAEQARLESRARLLSGGPAHLSVPKQPGPFHLLARGDFRRKGEVVAPGGIAAVAGVTAEWRLPTDAPEAERRKALAAWITDPRNPLTARVMVNRLWTGHFGAGLVRTPNDFGYNGGRPSHPELLDWLASALVQGNGETGKRGNEGSQGDVHPISSFPQSPVSSASPWSLKRLHRLILLSSTYQQASRPRAVGMKADAENRLLWRQNPRRLEAESFRDAVLFLSGDLDPRIGGPGYRDWTSKSHGDNEQYTTFDAVGPEFNRRTLYRMSVRAGTSPFLDALDCPEPSVSTPRRTESRQISRAYQLALGRDAAADEHQFGERFAGRLGLAQLCLVLFNTNEFLYVD